MTHNVKGILNVAKALELTSTTAPTAIAGRMFFDTTDSRLKFCSDGVNFLSIGSIPQLPAALFSGDTDRAVRWDFQTDQASTKTNITYDATEKMYYSYTAGAVVLEMPSKAAITNGVLFNMAVGGFTWNKFTIYDECESGGFNTAKFTGSGTNSQTGGYDQSAVAAPGTVTLAANNNTAGFNISAKWMMKMEASNTGSSGSGSWAFSIMGTTSGQVDWASGTGIAPGTVNGSYLINVDWATKSMTVWSLPNLTFVGTYDLSSIVGNYYFRVRCTTPADGTGYARFYYVREVIGTETSAVTAQFSANNGTNYYAFNNLTALPAVTGGAPRIRIQGTIGAGEGVIAFRARYIPLSAVDYN